MNVMEGVDFSYENEFEKESNELLELVKEKIIVPRDGSKPLEISLHAIAESPNPRTTRLMGRLREQTMVILVDTSSTHNFLDPTIVSNPHLTLNSKDQIEVWIANGQRIRSEGKLEGTKILV